MPPLALLRTARPLWVCASLLGMGLACAQALPGAPPIAEASQRLEGQTLALHGAGVRWRATQKVYALGLYLDGRAQTLAEVQALPGPKRLQLTMLRDIDADELGRLFSRGVEANLDRGAYAKVIPGVLRLGQLFGDHRRLYAGDALWIDWVPGTGTVLSVRGKVQGAPFKEPEFFEALLSVWLGPRPVDAGLKDALLGKPAAPQRPEPGA